MPFHLVTNISLKRKPTIFFTFPYISESYQLIFQIKYLYPLISKYVIVWSNISYSGKYLDAPRFEPFTDFLAPFFKNNTITLHYADLTNFTICDLDFYYDYPKNKENFRRKCVISSHTYQALIEAGIQEDDFFFYGDIDEYPTMECMQYLISHPPALFYNIPCLYSFYYSFRWDCDLKYYKFTYSRFTKKLTKNDIVNYRYLHKPVLANSDKVKMVHMNTIFQDVDKFKLKYRAYAHSQVTAKFTNLDMCALYLSIIKFYGTPSCHYHKNLTFLPPHIVNFPAFKFMFYELPFIDTYNFFISNCTHLTNSTLFTNILKKINS